MQNFKIIPNQYIQDYIIYCRATEREAEQSVVYISIFDNYCYKNWPGASGITQEMVDNWCKQRNTEKNNSTRSRIYPLINFLQYLQDRELTDIQLPDIPRHEQSTYIPHAFTECELSNFFHECDNYPINNNRLKDKNLKITIPVFFRLLYSSGIRTTEARYLKVSDVDLANGILNIHQSKGHSQHYIVLHDTMNSLLKQYHEAISILYPKRIYFFPTTADTGRSRIWVWSTFRKIWDKVNTSHATAYQLRHHYATENINRWIDSGFDCYDKLVYLSKSMGHNSLESTKYYYSIVPAMASIMEEKTEESFDDIIPEVDYEESDE